MANCVDITGINSTCSRDNTGGIKIVYLGVVPSGATMTDIEEYVTIEAGTDKITAFTGTVTMPSGSVGNIDLYKYAFTKDSATYTETPQHTNYGVGYEQVLTMDFSKMTFDVRNEIKLLSYNTKLVAVVVNNNNEAQVMAINGGMVTGGVGQTGASIGEENKYQIVITATENAPAYFATLAAVTDAIV